MTKKKKNGGADLPPQRVLQQQFDWDALASAPMPAPGTIHKSSSAAPAGDAPPPPVERSAAPEPPPPPTDRGDETPSGSLRSPAPPAGEPESGDSDIQHSAFSIQHSDDDAPPPSDPGPFSPRNGGPLARVMDENFLQFASYAICDRAIPTVEDGLKPVQRRILHTLSEMDDGRFVKVATVVGRTMFYHPHGDASIYGALVNLANKRYLIEGQGNFGNIYTGDEAAAPRYIECRLTDLARDEIFNKKTTAYIPSYDGRNQEPVLLPSKLPLLLMLGANGIAVGMATYILPHNFIELLRAEIEIVRNPKATPKLLPDFPTGGLADCSGYEDGNGRVRVRAKFEVREERGNKQVVVTELPYGQTTETLIASIENAARAKKVPVKNIHDGTSDHAEVILTLAPGTDPQKAIKQLYAATNCECSLTANMTVLENNRPVQTTVSHVLRSNVDQLLALNKRELEIREGELLDEQHRKTLVQIFVEERIYKRIEKCTTAEAVRAEIFKGFKPFADRLVRPIADPDVEMLLGVPIRRISLFDINKNREEIEGILKELDQVRKDLKGLRRYTVRYLENLIKKYEFHDVEIEVEPEPKPAKKGAKDAAKPAKSKKKKFKTVTVPRFPRLTKVEAFETIDVRAVTATKLDICYDPETGFLGPSMRGFEPMFTCSSADKLLLVWGDGRYKVIPAPEKDKVFVDKDLLLATVFDRDKLYTCVYTEKEVPFSCIKRFAFGGVIQNRDYSLLPEPGTIRLLEEGTPPTIWIKFRPAKGQRILQKKFDPSQEVAVKGVHARGKQITTKPISAIAGGDKPPRFWDDSLATEKGGLF